MLQSPTSSALALKALQQASAQKQNPATTPGSSRKLSSIGPKGTQLTPRSKIKTLVPVNLLEAFQQDQQIPLSSSGTETEYQPMRIDENPAKNRLLLDPPTPKASPRRISTMSKLQKTPQSILKRSSAFPSGESIYSVQSPQKEKLNAHHLSFSDPVADTEIGDDGMEKK